MEAERELRPIQVYMKCPDCNMDMVTNKSYSAEKQYENICRRCSFTITTDIEYPYIKYVLK